jgi:branched-chain amino acid aminotransferase
VTNTGSQKYAFFDGGYVPLEEAKVSVLTHALNYGTGVFEGIRGYWNDDHEEIYIFRLKEHYERFKKNTAMVCIDVPFSVDELADITTKLVAMHDFHDNVYIRPLAYKASEQIGVSMEGVEDGLSIVAVPFGNYVDIHRGLSVCVSSWQRSNDNAIPARAKVTGNYANTALIKNEAVLNGYDEAVVLNSQGYVAEGSAENIFLVRDHTLLTPSVADSILEGITRDTIIKLAERELGIPTIARQVARSELYYADEIILTGTGAQVAPVTRIDQRAVGDGEVGPVGRALQQIYFDVVRGNKPKYMDWLTPVKNALTVNAMPKAAAS